MAQDIMDFTKDPINRLYRYPVANVLTTILIPTPVTPNMISFGHTLLGLTGAISLAKGFIIPAFIILELRNILDCADGVLARRKNLSSNLGRAVDALADVISFLALMVGSVVYFARLDSNIPGVLYVVAATGTAFLMGTVFDFFRRRYRAAIEDGTDAIERDMFLSYQQIQGKNVSFVAKFGFYFDKLQILIFSPGSWRKIKTNFLKNSRQNVHQSYQSKLIHAERQAPHLKMVLRSFSLVGGDNILSIIGIGLITKKLELAFQIIPIYGCVSLLISGAASFWFLNIRPRPDAQNHPDIDRAAPPNPK